jgi:peptidoglycan/xylan/chitin deacetylase (PgdA/CDA1 family)
MARLRPLAVVAAVAVVGGGVTKAEPVAGIHELERLPTHRKLVALTFDGGGDTANGTALILATLGRRRVGAATFFLAGRWLRRHRLLARAIGRHYRVGNHTYDHAEQTRLTAAQISHDVRSGAHWVRIATGQDPRPLFRFPYGARDEQTIAVVNSLGYASIRWSIDTWGWMGRAGGQSVGTVLRRVSEHLEPGAIILMHVGVAHDGSVLDAQALSRVIRLVRTRGYRFVDLDRFVRPPR